MAATVVNELIAQPTMIAAALAVGAALRRSIRAYHPPLEELRPELRRFESI